MKKIPIRTAAAITASIAALTLSGIRPSGRAAETLKPDYESKYLAVGLSRTSPAFSALMIDSLGGGRLSGNPILPAENPASAFRFESRGGGEFAYRAPGAGAAAPAWTVICRERTIVLRSIYAPGNAAAPFVIQFDQKANHATLLGRMKPGSRRMDLPCVLHMPDRGSLRITASSPAAGLDYDARRYVPKPFVSVAFPPASAERPRLEYTLETAAIHPAIPGSESDPRTEGFRRSFLNLFQINPRVQMLANNASSDPVPFTLYMDALMAGAAPPLAPGLTAFDLVRMTLDRYLDGAKGYGLVGYAVEKNEADLVAWKAPWNSLDTYPSLLIAAGLYVTDTGDLDWARRSYDKLAAWAGAMFAGDKDDDGLIEHPHTGNTGDRATADRRPANWWDTINFGHKDAYSNALAYRAARLMAGVARRLGKPSAAAEFDARAARLRAAYKPAFLNPDTGRLAGWRSADGKLHDYAFTFVNGIAVAFGLLDAPDGNAVMDRILSKMKEVGFDAFHLGLPGNLIPVRMSDYVFHNWPGARDIGEPFVEDGSDAFQIYENGGATACYAYFTVKALYDLGRAEDARRIFYPMLRAYAAGDYQGFCENGKSKDWRDWKGGCHGYEGLLCDGFLALLCVLDDLNASAGAQGGPSAFHVSPAGNDAWSGRTAGPNAEGTDGPFATFERAAEAVRNELAARPAWTGEITVWIETGIHRRSKTWRLGPGDSGRLDRRVRWRAAPGALARITGDRAIPEPALVADPALLARLPKKARGKAVVADLRAAGIADTGEISPRGSPGLELFFRQERMPLAAYPDVGWLRIAGVPQSGPKRLHEGLDREKRFDGVPVGRHYGRIVYEGDRPAGWADDAGILVHGYWTWDWSDSFQKVASIDRAKREITLAEPHHNYGYTKNQRFRFLNVPEELDQPSEWVLDRAAGRLIFLPPAPPRAGEITISMLADPLIAIEGASNVSIEGLTFAESRGPGAVVRDSFSVILDACVFTNLGGDAVTVDGGSDNLVRGCDIHEVALGGIRLGGGDRKTLAPGRNAAVDNDIHHYSRWIRTGQAAVHLSGAGQTVAHNRIHDAPHEGIILAGNDHSIEFNEIFAVCRETGDSGALHTGRNWTWRGNVIRWNYFHDLKGPGLHGVMGVYLDDWASGFTVFGNLFVRAGRSVLIGGGRDNVVENNVFVEGAPSVHLDARGLSWAKYYFDGSTPTLYTTYDEVNASSPPYADRYPPLRTIREDEPALPKYNRIVRNVSWGGRWLDVYDANLFDFRIAAIKDNVIADSRLLRRLKPGFKGWDPYYLNIDLTDGYDLFPNGSAAAEAELAGNLFLKGDPGFIDPARGDFRLRPDSPVWKTGFQPIPFERIGLLTPRRGASRT